MRDKPIRTALVVVMLAATPAVRADRGSIPYFRGVQIFEPVQRALIAWNGTEEILVLSTELHASTPTKVLEVMPLPAEPEVKKGDPAIFQRATELINRKLADVRSDTREAQRPPAAKGPAGQVTQHQRIGAHDIRVTRVLSCAGFTEWVNDYLRRDGVENPQIAPAMTQIIEDYLRDGYAWFVFDVVELGAEPRTNDAIQYRFASDCLYYPLRISRLEEGETAIALLVLTPRLLTEFSGLARERVNLAHSPVPLTRKELSSLGRDLRALLGGRADPQLRVWNLHGRLDSFTADLLAR